MSGALTAMIGASGGRLLTVGSGSGQYGFVSGQFGSLTPTEFLSSVIIEIAWEDSSDTLIFWVNNAALPNSGWSTININGTTFLRTSATYSAGVWSWSGVSSNPIGTSGTIPVNIA